MIIHQAFQLLLVQDDDVIEPAFPAVADPALGHKIRRSGHLPLLDMADENASIAFVLQYSLNVTIFPSRTSKRKW